ncbi:MAG: hypothetical protein MUP58_01215 [Candidatus Nanohaloarchaeota archaeon QJJ-9]|nr:hypothetical protein [Candidatus Nanohaloarchaeota archaeon QJJ-9]
MEQKGIAEYTERLREKEKIGLDVDETLVQLLPDFLHYYNSKYGTKHRLEDFNSYRWWKVLDTTNKQSYKEMENYAKQFRTKEDKLDFYQVKSVPGAIQGLAELEENYKAYLITNRIDVMSKNTSKIPEAFSRHSKNLGAGKLGNILSEDRIYYTAGELSKTEVCKKEGIDKVIEDNAEEALELAKEDIKVFLLDRYWTQDYEEHENIVKVEGEGKLPYPGDDWEKVVKLLSDKTTGFTEDPKAKILF